MPPPPQPQPPPLAPQDCPPAGSAPWTKGMAACAEAFGFLTVLMTEKLKPDKRYKPAANAKPQKTVSARFIDLNIPLPVVEVKG